MERSERIRLEKIRRNLRKDLAGIESLLGNAAAPKRLSRAEIRDRATRISLSIKERGGPVSRDELREITKRHGFPFNAVGSLFVAGYLRKTGKGVTLGKGSLAVVRRERRSTAVRTGK